MDRKIQVSRITLHPPEFIIERYKALEDSRKPEQLRGFKQEVIRAEQAGQKKEVDLNKAIDYVTKNYKLFEGDRSKPDNPVLNVNQVQYFFKVPTRMAQYIADMGKKQLREDYRIKMESGKNGAVSNV